MPTNYVLIDFENVQPKNLDMLKIHPFKIFVFVGSNQTKVPLDLVIAIQDFGEDAQYIKISNNGQNALDFHIAYYIGRLSLMDPEGYFHIISKDTGFDPLIKHLSAKKIRIHRWKDLAEIPLIRTSIATNEKVEAIIQDLAKRGQTRPKKTETLANTINSLFTKKLNEQELSAFITKLQEQKYIKIEQGNVTYKLPKHS